MRCSVVILNWNGEQILHKFLPSVIAFSALEDCEVVVADNCSTDNSIAILKQYPSVRLIQLDKNYGFAEGYNRAIQQIDSQYIVLLNSDVEVTESWLKTMLDFADNNPDVVAVQPKILSYGNRTYFEHAGACGGFLDYFGYPYCRGRVLNKVEEDKGQYDTVCDVFWTSGACMLVRRDVYLQVGGLDALFFAYMEEIDLCWRLNARGYRLVCLPQSVVYHLGGGTLNYDSPNKLYLNFRNDLLMLYKNLPTPRLLFVLFIRFFLDYLVFFQNLLQGKFQHAWAVVRARKDFLKLRLQKGENSYSAQRKHNLQMAKIKFPTQMKGLMFLQ